MKAGLEKRGIDVNKFLENLKFEKCTVSKNGAKYRTHNRKVVIFALSDKDRKKEGFLTTNDKIYKVQLIRYFKFKDLEDRAELFETNSPSRWFIARSEDSLHGVLITSLYLTEEICEGLIICFLGMNSIEM